MRSTAGRTMRRGAWAAALCVLAAAAPTGAQEIGAAQEGLTETTYVSLGYVVNAPEQMLGGSAMTVGPKWGGWGLYADAKFTRDTPEDGDRFDPTLTADDVATQLPQDELFQEASAWRSLNAAVVRAVSPQFAVYAGAGVTDETAYDEYQSDERQGTAEAFYWVEDEAESSSEPNVLGGVFLRASRNLLFHFGGEANPAGATIGASLGLPLGG